MGYNGFIEDPNEDTDSHDGILERHAVEQKPQRLTWRTWLIGRPLPTADASQETIGKANGKNREKSLIQTHSR
jgi:hypothetical protein